VPSATGLQGPFRQVVEQQLLPFARSVDNRFHITSGRRTREEQVRLYNQWLKGLSPFPALPPGHSQHERGWAVDIARFNVPAQDDELLRELGALWREAGGVWGGESDPVHFEAPRAWSGRGT